MFNLGVRFILEILALLSLGYWGFTMGAGWPIKILLGLGAPLAAAIIWGAFIAPKANYHLAIHLRLLLEILIFGSAAAGLILAGQRSLGLIFAGIVAVNELLLFVWRQR